MLLVSSLSAHVRPQLAPVAAAGPRQSSVSMLGRQPAALTGATFRRSHRVSQLCQAKRKTGGSSGEEAPERLSAAEPLQDELAVKAKELRKRGKAALDAAQQAYLAATAAEEAAYAREEAAPLAAGAAQDMASDAADVAGAAQIAAADVQQEAEIAVRGAAADAASDAADVADSVQIAAQDVGGQAAGVVAEVASDAADVADSVQIAAQDVGGQAAGVVAEVASDAADVAGSVSTVAQDAAEQAADFGLGVVADVASDAADVVGSVSTAAQNMQQQTTADIGLGVVADIASDAADVAGSVQTAARDMQGQTAEIGLGAVAAAASDAADVAGSVSTAAQDMQQEAASGMPVPSVAADPAAQLPAPEQPVAALPAPGETSGALPLLSGDSSSGSSSPPPPPVSEPADASSEASAEKKRKADEIHRTKDLLVGMLASLDRGSAATGDQVDRVDELARRLEKLGGHVSLGWERPAAGGKPGMALLDGRWRLLYSSGFSSGSLGGRRPGPSFGSGPFTLGQVHQDIITDKSELDNCVDLFLRTSLAALPLPGMDIAVPSATARLRHTFSIIGANTVEITFTDTEVKLAGGLQGWLDMVPRFTLPVLPEWLQPPKTMRSARFDVCFLDEDMRITRGDRGELRVFLKGMV